MRKKKIETYANIDAEDVISAPDVNALYSVPLNFENERLGQKIITKLELKPRKRPNWRRWRELLRHVEHPTKRVKIAMVGKYVDIGDYKLADSYISVNQALEHAGAAHNVGIDISWIDSKELERSRRRTETLKGYHGILIPGGFGATGVEGKVNAIQYARESGIPFLGLCYGLQWAVVEFARTMCGMREANSTEVDPTTKHPVIDILPTQKEVIENRRYGASMRLGAYAASLRKGSKVMELYRRSHRLREDTAKITLLKKDPLEQFRLGILRKGDRVILERHRHRYEVAPQFIEVLEEKGLLFSGFHLRKDGTRLMEFLELPDHPFFVATQAHPEFKSRIERPAPLFSGFIEAAAERT